MTEARPLGALAACCMAIAAGGSGGGCGIDMPLEPTAWGQQVKDGLATPC